MGGLPNVYPGYQAVPLDAARVKFASLGSASLAHGRNDGYRDDTCYPGGEDSGTIYFQVRTL